MQIKCQSAIDCYLVLPKAHGYTSVHTFVLKSVKSYLQVLPAVMLLQPGDCVILNAANSTVGQVIIQLCRLLQLRCVALVRQREESAQVFTQNVDRLKELGASLVIPDAGSIKASCIFSCLHLMLQG